MEIFEIFDENNQLIGTAPRNEVHQKGLFHRAVDVFVINSKGQVLLTKRALNKDTSPGQWGVSVGEHLQPRESYEEAARRGLQEELGIQVPVRELRGPKFIKVVHPDGKLDNEFDSLFVAQSDGPFQLDSEEVAEYRFMEVKDIEAALQKGTMVFTQFFKVVWPEFKKFQDAD